MSETIIITIIICATAICITLLLLRGLDEILEQRRREKKLGEFSYHD